MIEKAKVQPVEVFARTVRRYEQERSQDDGVSWLEAQKQSRRAWIKTGRDDGMTVLYARFDPITDARIRNVLSAKTNALWREEDPKNRPSTEQRMAELLHQPTGVENGQKSRAAKSTLLLIAHYDIGKQTIRNATMADGTPIPVAAFRDMACREGKVIPAIFDTRGQPGRGSRLATPAQRMALITRDRRYVGCGTDPAWRQAHHVIPWEAKDPTDIDNMCLLCSRCHHQVHDEGWQIRQTPSGKHVMLSPTTETDHRYQSKPHPGVEKSPPVSGGNPRNKPVLRRLSRFWWTL